MCIFYSLCTKMPNGCWRVSLSPPFSPSCVTRKKNFSGAFYSPGLLTVTLNGLSERGNTHSLIAIRHFFETKAICGKTSPRVTVLALFYKSVRRETETKEITIINNNNNNNNNKLEERIKATCNKPDKN